MLQISKDEYKKCEVEIIDKGIYFWVNRKYLEVESDVADWAQIFDKCDPKKQKCRNELMPNTKFQQCRVFVRNDLVEKKKIKSCRKSSKRFLEFKKMLGLDHDVVTCGEQDIIKILHDNYKIGIEIDEYNHEYMNFNYEESRTKMIENHEITLIRTNPDDPKFDIKNLIVQVRICIKEAIKKQTKKSLISDLTKRSLESEFKSNYSIKSKFLKWVVFYQITKNEKHTIKDKTNKNWKTIWNNILFWV